MKKYLFLIMSLHLKNQSKNTMNYMKAKFIHILLIILSFSVFDWLHSFIP